MLVKTYRGDSTKAVMDQVKAELGPDAVILSTKNTRQGGKNVCELMAAVEPDSSPAPTNDDALGSLDAPTQGQGAPQWHQEWKHIKNMLLSLMGEKIDLDSLAPRQKQALDYLEKEGVDSKVLMTLYHRLKTDSQASVLSVLGEIAETRPWIARRWTEKFHVLVGPNGCGKTTSLIRMALAYKKENPDAEICIVNSCESGGKGRMILKHYAELSGMTYKDCYTMRDMQTLFAASLGFDRIFIDMPAVDRGQNLDMQLGTRGLLGREDMAVHVVLSPHYAPAQYDMFREQYVTEDTASVIWTKCDEACIFGELINWSENTRLPVAAVSFGSGIRGSMVPAARMHLWKLIFKHEMPSAATDAARAA